MGYPFGLLFRTRVGLCLLTGESGGVFARLGRIRFRSLLLDLILLPPYGRWIR